MSYVDFVHFIIVVDVLFVHFKFMVEKVVIFFH